LKGSERKGRIGRDAWKDRNLIKNKEKSKMERRLQD
jgi:hypothetical protein